MERKPTLGRPHPVGSFQAQHKLANEEAVLTAVEYVRRQDNPLALWIAPEISGVDGTSRGADATPLA